MPRTQGCKKRTSYRKLSTDIYSSMIKKFFVFCFFKGNLGLLPAVYLLAGNLLWPLFCLFNLHCAVRQKALPHVPRHYHPRCKQCFSYRVFASYSITAHNRTSALLLMLGKKKKKWAWRPIPVIPTLEEKAGDLGVQGQHLPTELKASLSCVNPS